MDEYHQLAETIFVNGFTADNHDFMALPNGNYILLHMMYSHMPWILLLQEEIQTLPLRD